MQYDWIDFYTEFATKLLPFKTGRKTLIQKIYAVYTQLELVLRNLKVAMRLSILIRSPSLAHSTRE